MATKNGKPRTIAPAPFVMDMLRDVRKRQLENRLRAGSLWNDQGGFVFSTETGDHTKAGTLNNHFSKIRNVIELPKLRFHDLRHTYAVASIQAGDDFKTISENVGHHSVAFTMDTYAHVTDAMRKKSSQNMERFYNGLSV